MKHHSIFIFCKKGRTIHMFVIYIYCDFYPIQVMVSNILNIEHIQPTLYENKQTRTIVMDGVF
jgi:hypothetical protein